MENTQVSNKITYTYLIYDGRLHKIGKSVNPEKRLKQIKTGNPHSELICFGIGVSEKYLHELYFRDRKSREWFELTSEKIENIIKLITNGENNDYSTLINGGRGKSNIWSFSKRSDYEKKKASDGVKKSLVANKSYLITFGKYKGTKLIDMVSDIQYEYCIWFYSELEKTLSKNGKKNSRQYKAFSWWCRIGWKEYENKSK